MYTLDELIKIMHKIRWDERFPPIYVGLEWNTLIEEVVDRLIELKSLGEESAK